MYSREHIINTYLDDPLYSIVLKYDYYFEEQLIKIISNPHIIYFEVLPSNKGFYTVDNTNISIYDFKTYTLVSQFKREENFDIFLVNTHTDMMFVYLPTQIMIIDVYTHKEVLTLQYASSLVKVHQQIIYIVDGNDIVTVDIHTGEEKVIISDYKEINDIFINDFLITFNYEEVKLWNLLGSPLLIKSFPNQSFKQLHLLSNRRVIFHQYNKPWMIWDLSTNELINTHAEKIFVLSNGNFIITEGKLRIVDYNFQEHIFEESPHLRYFTNIILLPNHQLMVSDHEEAIIWNLTSLKIDRVINFPNHSNLRLFPQGLIAIIGSDYRRKKDILRMEIYK